MIPLPDQNGPALHLVRHGQSTWNVRHLVQGQADDAELTELGRAQARSAADLLAGSPVERLLTSDLRRARQSADILGEVLSLTPVPTTQLREQALGEVEGLPTEQAAAAWEQAAAAALDEYGVPMPVVDVRLPGGESLRDVLARAQAFLALPWVTEAEDDVLVVSHGDTIRVLLAHLLGDDFDELTWREVDNGDVHSVYRTTTGAVTSVRTRSTTTSPDLR
jgi:broad specificity phosphatase PhoE